MTEATNQTRNLGVRGLTMWAVLMTACLLGPIFIAGCASGGSAGGSRETRGRSGANKWGVEDSANSGFMLRHDDIVWEQTNGPEGGDFTFIEINPWNPDELITGNQRSLYRSFDGGESWEKGEEIQYITDIKYSTTRPGLVYLLAQGTNVYRSTDGGDRWEIISPGDELGFAQIIEVAPDNPDVVYLASAEPARIYKSPDGGDSWREIARFPEEWISDLGVVREGVLIAGAGGNLEGDIGRLLISFDDGRSWSTPRLGQPRASFVNSVLVNPENPHKVFLGFGEPYNRAIGEQRGDFNFTSDDGGRTWRALPDDFHDSMIYYLACFGPDARTVYSAFGSSFEKSVDGGRSWELLLGKNPFDPVNMRITPVDIKDMAIHPEDRDILIVPLAGGGMAKSTDGGETWRNTNDGLLGFSPGNMAIHPDDPDTVYASGLPLGVAGTYKTVDGGETWEKLDKGGIYHYFTDELYIHPTEPNRVYNIADVGILFESRDGGATWHSLIDPHFGTHSPGRPATAFQFSSIYALETAEDNPDIVYAVKNGFGVFKSTDGGVTWRYQVFSPDYSYCLAVDPENPDIVYSGYQRKVFEEGASLYRNRPDEAEWDQLLTVPGVTGIRWIEIDPSDPRTMYAGVTGEEGEIYVSHDRGRRWDKLNDHLTFTTVWGHSQLQIDPRDPDTVFAGTWGGGSYRTRDGGRSWEKLDEQHTFSPTCIQISSDDPDVMYACDRTAARVHRSGDGGDTWEVYYDFRDDFGPEQFMTSAVAIEPGDPDTVIASSFRYPVAMAGKLVRIGPEGLEDDLSGDLPRSVLEIEFDESAPETVYLTTHVHGVYRSTNSGHSWERIDGEEGLSHGSLPRTGFYDVDVHPDDNRILYAAALSGELPDYMVEPPGVKPHLSRSGGGIRNIDPAAKSGVYRSTDGGHSWRQVLETDSEARGIDIDPDDPDRVFAADMTGGVWMSRNRGETWRRENAGLGSTSMTSVKVAGGRVYAGTQGSGVYAGELTSDESIRWIAERSNKPKAEVSTVQIEVDPNNPRRIYAGAYPGGLLRSDDGGKTWNDKNFLTPSIRVEDPNIQGYYSFAINPRDPRIVWMGVYGKGMFVSRDGMDYAMKADGRNATMRGKRITTVLINPADPTEVWAASEEGVYRTRDGGATWNAVNDGLHTTDVYVMSFSGDGTLYAGTRGYGVYRFDRKNGRWDQRRSVGNFGVYWSPWDRAMYQYSDMLIDPGNPDIWYLASFPTGMYKSTDAGKSWRESNVGFIEDGTDGIFSITFHPHDTSTIFAGTYNGVSVTRDGGKHWERIADGMDPEMWPFSVAVDPYDPNIMYAATKNGKDKGFHDRHEPPYDYWGKLYKTTDGGGNWFPIMKNLGDDQEFYTVLIHPKNRNILFVNTSHDGVYMSTDAGASWYPINTGLEVWNSANTNNVSHSLVLSEDGRYLYFGTMGAGVWKAQLY